MKFLQIAIEEVIATYNGTLPLSHFLKSFFKSRSKLGSRDRRAISDAVYSYYRLARFVDNPKEKIWAIINRAVADQLIDNAPVAKIIAQLDEPQTVHLNWENSFSETILSGQLNKATWFKSLLTLPLMFIRVRKNNAVIENILQENNIAFQKPAPQTISLNNGINLANILPETMYVIQDYSSQRSLNPYFTLRNNKPQAALTIWDTCSGAGGKMILLKDHFKESNILCTDIRPGILHNLRERAKLYGHKQVQTRLLDASKAKEVENLKETFDLVLSDVPCTGSGTWARTPEQFYFFEENNIQKFATLQYTIAHNACKKVKPGGHYVYITCSVFREENEAVVEKLLNENPHLQLLQQELINGIPDQADCMFVAVMQAH